MRPEILQNEFRDILEKSILSHPIGEGGNEALTLSDSEMFRLWNILGEELGIDLSLASSEQRKMLFDACDNGRKLMPKDFGSLLWLVYYGDAIVQ